jgi:hypothetical protein
MVISTVEELNRLQTRLNAEPVFVYIVPDNRYTHPVDNSIATFHFLFEDGTYMCLGDTAHHPDAPNIPTTLELQNWHRVYTPNKKHFLHLTGMMPEKVIDVTTVCSLYGKELTSVDNFYPPIISKLYNTYKFPKLQRSIPLVKWSELGETYLHHIKSIYESLPKKHPAGFTFVNDRTIPTLTEIEKAGLYTTDGYVYSEYNIYTSTGRPSNAFGGINFAALNKHDGSRERFVSRFGSDGILVQFDYEAFHLRLAANLIGYNLPETSVHTYLAEQYYGTSEITPEMYDESKARTFAIMYGQTDDIGNVEFFYRLKRYSIELWNLYCQRGFITSGTGRNIIVPDPNPAKVFNYLMQLMETEDAITRIQTVCEYLKQHQSKVILYTYDAILLDVHLSELESMGEVGRLLSIGGYPVREYRGNNYNNLILHKI